MVSVTRVEGRYCARRLAGNLISANVARCRPQTVIHMERLLNYSVLMP